MTPDKTPSEAELLPCPFCGEAAKHSFNSLYGDMSMSSCKSCGATAYAPKWNRRAVLAKWGTPATGVEPAGTVGYAVHGTQYVNWRTKPPAHGTPIYTTPQPTQPQAGAVPLDEARSMFDAGWKAAALFCEREDVVADGIIGFGACPQFEAALAAGQATAPQAAVPPNAITAAIVRDDGGEAPAFCLMAAYRSEKDAMDAFALIAAAPATQQAGEMEVFGLQWPGEDRINLSTVFDTETEALEYMQNRCDTPGIRLVRFSSKAPHGKGGRERASAPTRVRNRSREACIRLRVVQSVGV